MNWPEIGILDDRPASRRSTSSSAQAEEGARQPDVVEAAQVLVETGSERQQAGDMAGDLDHAGRGHDDACQDLEERALAGAVGPDDGQRLSLHDPEGDLAQAQNAVSPPRGRRRFVNVVRIFVLRVKRRL